MKRAQTLIRGRARISWVTTKSGTVARASVAKVRVKQLSDTEDPDVVVKRVYAMLLGKLATKRGMYCEALELELPLKEALCVNHTRSGSRA